jgi:pimeloyl-ACP methyl ester carboxylesterase
MSWRGAIAEAASRGFRLIAFDLRGHGESSWASDGDYTIASSRLTC